MPGSPDLRARDGAPWLAPLAFAGYVACLTIYFVIVEGQGRLHADMAEAYAWGREFQLGYNQHPPFWAWICGLWFRVFPRAFWAFALLDAVNAAIGLWGAWRAIGEFTRGDRRLAATALLALTPCYSIFAFKYNANIIFLSLWPWTLFAFLRSLRGGLRDGALFGLLAGAMMLSKYYALLPLLACALAALTRPGARAYLRSPSPWAALIVAAALFAPHALWLIAHKAPPLQYLSSQSGHGWAEMAGFEGQTLLGALEMMALPALILAGAARTGPRAWRTTARARLADPDFRRLAILALAPLLLSLIAALALRTRIYPEMVVAMFPLTPLLLLEIADVRDLPAFAKRTRRLAVAGAAALALLAAPAALISVYGSARAMNSLPDREVAEAADAFWRGATPAPLAFVAGRDGMANSAAFFLADGPSAFIDFDMRLSPWVSRAALTTKGVLAICREADAECLARAEALATARTQRLTVELRHVAWGHVAAPFRFVLSATPPL